MLIGERGEPLQLFFPLRGKKKSAGSAIVSRLLAPCQAAPFEFVKHEHETPRLDVQCPAKIALGDPWICSYDGENRKLSRLDVELRHLTDNIAEDPKLRASQNVAQAVFQSA